MGRIKDIFALGAKLGALESYLYTKEKGDPKFFPNWIGNIVRMVGELSPLERQEIEEELKKVLKNALEWGDLLIEEEEKTKIKKILDNK